jgi:molybdopterin molybdotransferase
LLAASGIKSLKVYRKIKIAVFSTGDELIPIGQPLSCGKIYDSNRYLLSALLKDCCFELTDAGVIADNKKSLEDKFVETAKYADVIITTGGASVGDADYIKEVLETSGKLEFWKIAIKPGKPLTFGKINDCYFFGLPGNPVSALVGFEQFVAPALKKLGGFLFVRPFRLKASCNSELKKSPGRTEFQRGVLGQNDNGDFFVYSAGQQGSHIQTTSSIANCFIVLPPECQGVAIGDSVWVEPFSLFI